MGDSKTLAALLLAMLIPTMACTHLRLSMRDPGEQLRDFPEIVSEEYRCGDRHLPFFQLEHNELVPVRVRAGGEFNHRMVYALCPAGPTDVVRGTMATRIRFEGSSIVEDQIDDYVLRPGRWVVDALVRLPENARIGVYALEVEFESDDVSFTQTLTFAVEAG